MTLIDAITLATSAKKTLVAAIANVETENEAVAAEQSKLAAAEAEQAIAVGDLNHGSADYKAALQGLIDAANEEITSLG